MYRYSLATYSRTTSCPESSLESFLVNVLLLLAIAAVLFFAIRSIIRGKPERNLTSSALDEQPLTDGQFLTPATPTTTAPARTNTLAIVAFVVVFFAGFVGLVLGYAALGQIEQSREGGRGLAVAAVVLGWISTAIGIVTLLILFFNSAP